MATQPMIVSGTYPSIHIDLGKDEPGMTLQYRERGYIVWRDYTVGDEAVLSPVESGKSNSRFFCRPFCAPPTCLS